MLLSLHLSLDVCRLTHLSVVPEGPLEQSLLDQSSSHFHLQHPLCPPPALVGISGVEDEQHQQVYHLTWQCTFYQETYRYRFDFLHVLNFLKCHILCTPKLCNWF